MKNKKCHATKDDIFEISCSNCVLYAFKSQCSIETCKNITNCTGPGISTEIDII